MLDGLSLWAVNSELQPLVGGKLDKIQQPERDALLLMGHGSSEGGNSVYGEIQNEFHALQRTMNEYQSPISCICAKNRH